MAPNVESAMYLGRRPAWVDVGTVVQDAPTSDDALRLAGLAWDVVPASIQANFHGFKAVKGYKANVRVSDGSVLGIVSDKYKILQNSEAFAFVDALLEMDATFEAAGSIDNGKRVWLLAHLPTYKILGDDVCPYVCFTNGHDGKHAVQVIQTPTRVVCENTLNAALGSAKRMFTMKHMGDIQGHRMEAQIALNLTTAYGAALQSFAESMVEKKINDRELSEIIEQIFPTPADDASITVKDNVDILRTNFKVAMDSDDLLNFKGTAWGVYNAFADMASHMEPIRLTKNYKEKRFTNLLDGNKMLDKAQKILQAA